MPSNSCHCDAKRRVFPPQVRLSTWPCRLHVRLVVSTRPGAASRHSSPRSTSVIGASLLEIVRRWVRLDCSLELAVLLGASGWTCRTMPDARVVSLRAMLCLLEIPYSGSHCRAIAIVSRFSSLRDSSNFVCSRSPYAQAPSLVLALGLSTSLSLPPYSLIQHSPSSVNQPLALSVL